ncbi:uncharacterized protein LOC113316301 [Papaver somniferum]|uniref:uncharacterized protein LOC113316301 n=1 Tax=Papaver somniferum TaxID=3469 RepID=UPI000E6F5481|nr:uncharacterized protein LOC113316301 [Papaver somniferum]
MKVVEEFQQKEKLDWRINCSFICLLPKKDQIGSPQDFRPISLVSSVYKVISKVLTQRLKTVLPQLISENQDAFIKDKQILDGILIAGDLIDSRLKRKVPGVLCKLDIQKAFDNDSLPLKYLGLPVGATSRSCSIWDVVIEKFQKKLAPWKRGFFTKAGTMLLIKTTLSSLPIYFMSLFPMPVQVEKKINQIMRNLLWGSTSEKRKINWVACNRICTPKKAGGLGIRNIKLTNQALLAKWTWRYSVEKQHLWRKIVQNKMKGRNEDIMVKDSNLPQGRGLWKEIHLHKKVVEEMKTIEVRSRNNIYFWWDKWKDNQVLKCRYPQIFKISIQKNASIKEVIENNSWNLKLRRNLHQSELLEMLQLFEWLGSPPILSQQQDGLTCNFT